LIGRVGGWVARYRAEIGLSLRITIAGLLTYAVGQFVSLTQVYWAVLTAIIVMQASVGGSLNATIDRLVGTIAGAAWGVAATLAVPHPNALATAGALALALVPLAVLVALRPGYRVAPVTATIVLLGPSGAAGVVEAAFDRVVEIALGCAVALAVAVLTVSSRAHLLLGAAAADALAAMRDQVVLLLEGVTAEADSAAVLTLNDRIRGAVEKIASTAPEVARERSSYLTDAPDPDPLVRTLRRLSHDLVMIARALSAPLPEPVRDRVAEPARHVAAAISAFLDETGTALARRGEPPPLDAVVAALAEYDAAMAALRRDRLIVPLPAEDAERVFGLAFALQQMRGHLEELGGRVQEMSTVRGRASAPAGG
jgi:uncharacterized membrane protein YccC